MRVLRSFLVLNLPLHFVVLNLPVLQKKAQQLFMYLLTPSSCSTGEQKKSHFKSFSESPSKCCISSMNKFNNRKGEYENRKEFSVAKEIRMARKIDKSKRRE